MNAILCFGIYDTRTSSAGRRRLFILVELPYTVPAMNITTRTTSMMYRECWMKTETKKFKGMIRGQGAEEDHEKRVG